MSFRVRGVRGRKKHTSSHPRSRKASNSQSERCSSNGERCSGDAAHDTGGLARMINDPVLGSDGSNPDVLPRLLAQMPHAGDCTTDTHIGHLLRKMI